MELNRISREEFLKLKEEDLFFITNPGRMGDEDGSTFIIKDNNEYKAYRVDGWMYPNKDIKEIISFDDMIKQFPKWYDSWKNNRDKDYKGKYHFIYMGFGNGLCVDNSIYEEYKPFLEELVESYLEKEEDKESLKYAAIYNSWQNAVINMIKSKKTL